MQHGGGRVGAHHGLVRGLVLGARAGPRAGESVQDIPPRVQGDAGKDRPRPDVPAQPGARGIRVDRERGDRLVLGQDGMGGQRGAPEDHAVVVGEGGLAGKPWGRGGGFLTGAPPPR